MYCADEVCSSSDEYMEVSEYEEIDIEPIEEAPPPPPPPIQPVETPSHTVHPLRPWIPRMQRIEHEMSYWEWMDLKRIAAQRSRINKEKVKRMKHYTIDNARSMEALVGTPLPKPYPSLYINMCQEGQGLKVSKEYLESPFREEWPSTSPYAMQLNAGISVYRAPNNLLVYEATKEKIETRDEMNEGPSQRSIEDIVARNIDKLVDKMEDLEMTLVGDMETFPMTLTKREPDTLLRPVIIDAVGITMLYHKAHKKKMIEYGRTKNGKFISNMKLVMKPIIQIAIYYLALGHKIIVVVPTCYEADQWKEDEKRVDNIVAFEHLLRAGVVKFLAEHTTEVWMASTRFFADEIDGLLVSNSFFWKHIVSKSLDERLRTNDAGLCVSRASDRLVTPTFVGPTRIPMICHHFTFQIDASQKFDLKGYGGNVVEKRIKDKRCLWVKEGVVRNYHEDTKVDYAIRLENQLKLKDQMFQLHLLENLYELPHRLQRAYHVVKYFGELITQFLETTENRGP